MTNNRNLIHLLIITDIQTKYDQAENPFSKEGIELLQIISNAEDGVSRAIELKPDCKIEAKRPNNAHEHELLPFRF